MQVSLNARSERVAEFKELLIELCRFAEDEKVFIKPFNGDGPMWFGEMPEQFHGPVLGAFRGYVELCREVRAEGISLRNDQFLLWRMFQKLGVHPPSELMSEMRSGEVIEIHNGEFLQVYRNLRFFELCSYTLDDLLCRPFWQLFQRDESVTESLIKMGQSVFGGDAQGVLQLDTPEHVVLEIDSEARLLSVIQHRIAAPLRASTGEIKAGVTFIKSVSCVPTATTIRR